MKPTQEQVVEWFNQSISHEKRYAGSTYRLANLAFAAGQASTIPEGWKLVPVEPTDDMVRLGGENTDSIDWSDASQDEPYELAEKVYRAMIAAAPSQETGE